MTYQSFFKLNDTPFRLTPDVDYFFSSESHGSALETLLYSIRSGEGFVQITGQPGVGKTILVRHLLNQLGENVKTALILHPRLNAEDLLKVILEDLGVSLDVIQNNTKEGLLRYFRKHLLETGREGCNTVVIVDEAQEIPEDTLEELRLLSNLETEKKKLLSIILVGQTELEEKLNRRSLSQLHQRITIRYRIEPFSRNETTAYILHRLSIAGAAGNINFSDKVLKAIHKHSGGIPRRINVICERALMAACIEGVKKIKNSHLKSALESYLGAPQGFNRRRYALSAAILMGILIIIGGSWWAFSPDFPKSFALYGKTLERFNNGIIPKSEAPAEITTENLSDKADLLQSSNGDPLTSLAEMSNPENPEIPPIDMLPENWRCLLIDRYLGQGQVWEGNGKSVYLKASFEAQDIHLKEGVYILGTDEEGTPFIFNHLDFSPWHGKQDLADLLWSQFSGDMSQQIIPLIVRSGESEVGGTHFQQDSAEIRRLIEGWASAWRSLDIDTYIQYHGPSYIHYHSMRNEPTVISREKYYRQKARLFKKTGFVALQISEPVCIINPANPDTAVAIFSQRYVSINYRDEGIKAFFLRRIREGDEKKAVWKIEGRFWTAVPSESDEEVVEIH
jgi:type II secretory pathway predicted ATPase ExeA